MIGIKSATSDVENERKKIINGVYSLRIIQGRQNKHIIGTREFEQNSEKMNRLSPGSKPSIITADAKMLVEKYKGSGKIRIDGLEYPQETITTDEIIGKSWVISKQKYADTKSFRIIYSSVGVHVIPVSDYKRR
jgi:hypothetical protein